MNKHFYSLLENHRPKASYWEARHEEKVTYSLSRSSNHIDVKRNKNDETGIFYRTLNKGVWQICNFKTIDEFRLFLNTGKHENLVEKKCIGFVPGEGIQSTNVNKIQIDDITDATFLNSLFDSVEQMNKNDSKFDCKLTTQIHEKVIINSENTHVHSINYDAYAGINFYREKEAISKLPIFLGKNQSFGLSDIPIFRQKAEFYLDYVRHLSDAIPKTKQGQNYNYVLISPELSSLLIHEIIGHALEADVQIYYPHLRDLFGTGNKISDCNLNISDNPEFSEMRGHIVCDDEGVAAKKVQLVENGKVVGRMHTRETASLFEETLTGNARALNYSFNPICRMTNTILESNTSDSYETVIASIKNGLLLDFPYGGRPDYQDLSFSINALYARRIINGKLSTPLGAQRLIGNIKDILMSIVTIGNDTLEDTSSIGCGKGGQRYLRVGQKAPYLLIRNAIVVPFNTNNHV